MAVDCRLIRRAAGPGDPVRKVHQAIRVLSPMRRAPAVRVVVRSPGAATFMSIATSVAL